MSAVQKRSQLYLFFPAEFPAVFFVQGLDFSIGALAAQSARKLIPRALSAHFWVIFDHGDILQ